MNPTLVASFHWFDEASRPLIQTLLIVSFRVVRLLECRDSPNLAFAW